MDNETETNTSKCHELFVGDLVTPAEQSQSARYVILAILLLIPCLTILANSLMLLAVLTHKKLQTLSSAFVGSLAVADLLIAFLAMPFGIYQQFNHSIWELGKATCLVTTCLYMMLTTTSIYNLCCLTIDRYVTICKPYVHQRMKLSTVALSLSLCWILPALLSFLPIMNTWNHIGIEEYIDCQRSKYSSKGQFNCVLIVNKSFATIGSLLAFYIPAVCMLFCYVCIYRTARHHAKQIYHHRAAAQQKQKLKSESRAKKTILAITGCFFICWSPYYILNVIDPFVGYQIPQLLWTAAIWMGYINSVFNPILFCNYNTHYKKAIKMIITHKILRLKNTGHLMSDMTNSVSKSPHVDKVRKCSHHSYRRVSTRDHSKTENTYRTERNRTKQASIQPSTSKTSVRTVTV